jgi:hypothetical protein
MLKDLSRIEGLFYRICVYPQRLNFVKFAPTPTFTHANNAN